MKERQNTDTPVCALPFLFVCTISLKRMSGKFIERVEDPVAETFEVGIAVGQLQDLLDQGVPSLDRTVGDSSSFDLAEGIEDLRSPFPQSQGELFEFSYSGTAVIQNDIVKFRRKFLSVFLLPIVEADIAVIELIGKRELRIDLLHLLQKFEFAQDVMEVMIVFYSSVLIGERILEIEKFVPVFQQIVFIAPSVLLVSFHDSFPDVIESFRDSSDHMEGIGYDTGIRQPSEQHFPVVCVHIDGGIEDSLPFFFVYPSQIGGKSGLVSVLEDIQDAAVEEADQDQNVFLLPFPGEIHFIEADDFRQRVSLHLHIAVEDLYYLSDGEMKVFGCRAEGVIIPFQKVQDVTYCLVADVPSCRAEGILLHLRLSAFRTDEAAVAVEKDTFFPVVDLVRDLLEDILLDCFVVGPASFTAAPSVPDHDFDKNSILLPLFGEDKHIFFRNTGKYHRIISGESSFLTLVQTL